MRGRGLRDRGMSSLSPRHSALPGIPFRDLLLGGLLLALGLSGLFGCAARAPGEDPASERARPIDLSPRCVVFEPLEATFEPLPDGARSRRLGRTLEAVVLPRAAVERPGSVASAGATLAGGLERLRWATPVSAFASPTHARAAFFVWSLGELSADPVALRQRLRGRGIALSTARLGDRVVLDLVFPASELEAALAAWRTLMAPEAIASERLGPIRRELALLLLAEEAAPGAAARRLRRSLRADEPAPEPSPGAGPRTTEATAETGADMGATEATGVADAQGVLDELDGESLRDAMSVALQSESAEAAHLLVYSGPATNADARFDTIEAALDRLEQAAASWPGPWHAAPAGPRVDRAESRETSPRVPESGAAPAIHLLDQPGARQVELLATAPTVGREAEDLPALEMLASLLGDPLGGRLFRDLRERQGLAYEIGAQQTAEGDFEVSTRTRPERLAALMAGIEAHWAALTREPIEACELAMLQERMHGLLALEADEPTARLDGLVRSWAGPGSPSSLAARMASYRAVSQETLERVVRRWLAGPPEWLLVGDASRAVDRLREAFPDRRIVVYDASLEVTYEVGGP